MIPPRLGMLEVRHLHLVRAIAEEGGPTRAAARLHLTQSAVSHQLVELEGRLGVSLFTRLRRRLVLTPAGERLVDAAGRLIDDLDRVERDLHRAGRPARTLLRATVESFTTYEWLPEAVATLASEHPATELVIVPEARREPIPALVDGKIDVAIVSTKVRDRDLAVTELGRDEWTIIVAPTHPLAKRRWLDARDLGGETLLVNDAPRSDVERLRAVLARERAAMPRVSRVPLTDVLVNLVRAGAGVGLVSRWAVASFTRRADVVARRFTRAGLPETWSIVHERRHRDALPVLECLTKVVRRHFEAALAIRTRM
jgi:LysR family transcriptional regulator, regulator for metE and metH